MKSIIKLLVATLLVSISFASFAVETKCVAEGNRLHCTMATTPPQTFDYVFENAGPVDAKILSFTEVAPVRDAVVKPVESAASTIELVKQNASLQEEVNGMAKKIVELTKAKAELSSQVLELQAKNFGMRISSVASDATNSAKRLADRVECYFNN